MTLHGKKALVIGGAVGIGRAVCQAFAAAGACVGVADRGWSEEKSSIVAELKASGVDAYCDEVDVRDEGSVSKVIQHAISRFGQLDILVNNAGMTSAGAPMHEQDSALWSEIFATNVNGIAFGMKHVLPHMLERGFGRIINTSSQLAHKPVPNHGAYCASKAAVTALTASVAQEVARRGITVNCVCPGMTDTAMLYKGGAAFVEEKLKALPIGRPGTVAEIAATYVFLASDAAAFFIGQSLSPNGGDVMW
ncbi:SDR family NAD(P)-dependent oxidoreductase [Mesorhizobium sp. M7A.F.Ca.US.006.01.1.1]|uniref:SDR family NAD(P)-dependent oxidoreductase n=1 Tax=Mesorhizobium sp. M7A.F.Ca.US.006.01.1.1 TaxID=2496707 RepID=UPI0013E2A6F1|nr:SDR family NAD(P)-dependent oxidoreductase [Mesorhizobium sp. M7A.F.Ca.US.006.01.1.1]